MPTKTDSQQQLFDKISSMLSTEEKNRLSSFKSVLSSNIQIKYSISKEVNNEIAKSAMLKPKFKAIVNAPRQSVLEKILNKNKKINNKSSTLNGFSR